MIVDDKGIMEYMEKLMNEENEWDHLSYQLRLRRDQQIVSGWTNTIQITIQYKICKAPCCRGFRGAGEQVS